jgi:hypothetical protein
MTTCGDAKRWARGSSGGAGRFARRSARSQRAAAREDDDFADLALQESAGKALSVDARGLEVGARHRLGFVGVDPQALFRVVVLALVFDRPQGGHNRSFRTRQEAGNAATSREGGSLSAIFRSYVVSSDLRRCLSSAAILLLLQANPRAAALRPSTRLRGEGFPGDARKPTYRAMRTSPARSRRAPPVGFIRPCQPFLVVRPPAGPLREKVPSVRSDLSTTFTCGSIPRSSTSQPSISAEP